MKAAVIVFPGSNCDRDLAVAFQDMTGEAPAMVWHKESQLPDGLDIIGIPGGFSFGDYLRCGAIAARSPICRSVVEFANRGGHVLGICNGFQILTETGVLPGVLMRNKHLKYICKDIDFKVETANSAFTNAYSHGQTIRIPIAHHDGNFTADETLVAKLKSEDRIAFTYQDNPNGSAADIAGILSENRRVLGMMPHPERLNDAALGGTDGKGLFRSLAESLVSA
jgi:phosphoribosylformylglycinamidine synthase subunit PurQ / glutaminase